MMNEDLSQRLMQHPFLQGLNGVQLERIAACSTLVRFDPGARFMIEGERAGTLYLIRAGRVALEVHLTGRGDLRVESLEPGDVLGFSWLFPPQTWQLDARAVEAVEAIAVDGTKLRSMMQDDHSLGYLLALRLSERMYERLRRVRLQRLDVYNSGR